MKPCLIIATQLECTAAAPQPRETADFCARSRLLRLSFLMSPAHCLHQDLRPAVLLLRPLQLHQQPHPHRQPCLLSPPLRISLHHQQDLPQTSLLSNPLLDRPPLLSNLQLLPTVSHLLRHQELTPSPSYVSESPMATTSPSTAFSSIAPTSDFHMVSCSSLLGGEEFARFTGSLEKRNDSCDLSVILIDISWPNERLFQLYTNSFPADLYVSDHCQLT